MQAWALQQILKKLGHEPITIDRKANVKGRVYYVARMVYRSFKKTFGKRKVPINFERHLPIVLQHTYNFIEQNIEMSEPLDSTPRLKAHFERAKYDAVIVGSDQTWRPKYSPSIENFFLDFLETDRLIRIAYASSFGVNEWEFTDDQTKRCAELIRKFHAISVREDSAVELCIKHLSATAHHVLDPTLLLDKADYIRIIGGERVKPEPVGVFTYFLDSSPQKRAMASSVADMLNSTVYSCQPKSETESNFLYVIDDYIRPDPRDWLASFANANFILTDSFHGVVFSILFNKPFIAIGNRERGLSRFKSLLTMFDLTERLVLNCSEDLSELVSQEFDWDSIGLKLQAYRNDSLKFLTTALSIDG